MSAAPSVFETGLFYDTEGCLLLDTLPEPHVLFECGPQCSCTPQSCPARVAQRGVHAVDLIVGPTSNRGLALFTKQTIQRGTFVCSYVGEILSTAEARRRWKVRMSMQPPAGNYVLVLRETGSNGHTLKTIIDPTHRGNIARFISQ